MCGIAGYIGERNAPGILFDMLKKLEYRGYDSAGVACFSGGKVIVSRGKGKVDEVRKKSRITEIKSTVGIAHTRWATHGEPSDENSHPHSDCTGQFTVCHNGIVENYKEIRVELSNRGHKFLSQTDTEVIPHLIEELYSGDFETAFVSMLKKLKGSFALVAVDSNSPDRILVARKESPLIIGVGKGENFIASDTPAVLADTKKVIILEDMEYGIVKKDGVLIKRLDTGIPVDKEVHDIKWDVKAAEKDGYDHYMLKEIFEEPAAVKNALRGLENITATAKKLSKYERIYIVACGTASYAGQVGRYVFERYGISAEVVIASEFRYSTINTVDKKCAVIAVSQSGETADTLASVKEAKNRGAYIISVVNAVGSSLTRMTDDNIYTYSGPEIAVASTKAYVGQATTLTLLALSVAKEKGKITEAYQNEILDDLYAMPDKINSILNSREKIKKLAAEQKDCKSFFYLGRRLNYPTALEGALKLKEISYIHAEAYPGGELKHGPLALLEKGVTVIAVCPNDDLKEKMESNMQEARARKATLLRVAEDGEFTVPVCDPVLSPILYVVPLHLFAYYLSTSKGIDPDKPRNLAKSVTVE